MTEEEGQDGGGELTGEYGNLREKTGEDGKLGEITGGYGRLRESYGKIRDNTGEDGRNDNLFFLFWGLDLF